MRIEAMMIIRITLKLVLLVIMRMLILSIIDHTMMLVIILLLSIKEEGIEDLNKILI
jgi:hypothetical protein